ncbi:MAG: hypothetical protein CMD96_08920 [Gammaproteobacteria bacterium]|jgi:uncharacterized protein (TIGR02646 family)|nr:hypothetical protein [Gammaproteobacteria bacterium]HJP19229.1 HNH endonuclease [Nitrospinota bacterium]|tara:strand:+ start:3794 stop:4393 length:600 start_codon:yes stop_codon:yes gene_type:complete
MEPVRRETPRRTCKKIFKNYKKYKKYLRDDFHKRCGYCDDSHFYSGGERGFHIDHFAPGSKFPEYKCRYSNLVYSCSYCNIFKGDDWVSSKSSVSVINDKGYIDPCSDDYEKHLSRNDKGQIIANTPLGKYMHGKLKLWLIRHEWAWKIDKIDSLIEDIDKESANFSNKDKKLKRLQSKQIELYKAFRHHINIFREEIQ